MPRPTPTRSQRRRRLVRRRRAVAVVVSLIIVAALVVGVIGFVRSLGDRDAAKTPDAGAQTTTSHTTAAESAPPAFDVDATADEALAVLADASDAARPLEDALYQATQALRAATTAAQAEAARAATAAAVDAVTADAAAFRAQLASDASDTLTQPAGGDVAAQLAYLHQHVFAYNSAQWGDYNPYGGDCTNFASQGLIARGWHTDGAWYSEGPMWTASKPWIATAAMASYFESLGLSYATQDDLDRVRVGDIGLFDWGETGANLDHTMTVSRVEYRPDGPPVVSFISHNEDGEFRELTHALDVEHSGSTVRIYHIP